MIDRRAFVLAATLSACCATGRESGAVGAAEPPRPPVPPASAVAGGFPGVEMSTLTPPTQPGQSRSSFTGCVTAASEQEGLAFAATRSSTEVVKVSPVPGGAQVFHDFSHACCLKARVSTEVQGRVVLVREEMFGAACRCICTSAITTAVSLEPGTWNVAVELVSDGESRTIASQDVEVPAR